MILLAIDSSTDACSAALLTAEGVCTSRFAIAPRQHTTLLPTMLSELLSEAETDASALDAVSFTQGPGSFAGIRIACGMAQGLALAVGCPLIPVSTLQVLAQAAYSAETAAEPQLPPQRCIAALDARMGELYLGVFDVSATGIDVVLEDQVIEPGELAAQMDKMPAHAGGYTAVGEGWTRFPNELHQAFGQPQAMYASERPTASALLTIAARHYAAGNYSSLEQAQPVYLRDKVAVRPRAPVDAS